MSAPTQSHRSCTSKDRGVRLKVLPHASNQAFPHSPVRKSKSSRWRAGVLIVVHALIAAHIIQWLISGLTVSPVEPSESMYTLEVGKVNAGFVFFAAAILSTLIFGRFFCGWGCHMVALQDLCSHWMNRIGVRPRQFRSRLLLWAPLGLAVYMFVWPSIRRGVLWPAVRWSGREGMQWVYTHLAPSPVMVEWAGKLDLRLPLWMGEPYAFPGFTNHFLTENFWATFPPWWVAIPFLLTCTFAMVYFLGSKGLCTYACPYGGFFGVVDRVSVGRIVVNDKCEGCGHCTAVCTSNVRVHQEVRDFGQVVDPGCLKCMDCVSVCPNDALSFKFAKPPAFGVAKTPSSPRPRYDLLAWEEVTVAIIALACFYCWRSAFNVVPMLMAASTACIGGFLAWKTWSLLKTPNVRLQSLQLRVGGRLRPAGFALIAGAALFFSVTAWFGWVRVQRSIAAQLDGEVMAAQEVVFAPGYTPDPEQAAIAQRAVALLTRSGPRDTEKGMGWNLTPELWNRRAWLSAVAGDLPEAQDSLERGMAEGKPAEAIVIAMHQIHALQGKQPADFVATLRRVLERNPSATHVRVALGYGLLQSGLPEQAKTEFTRAMDAEDSPDPAAVFRAVDALTQTGHQDQAAASLDALIATHPRRWEYLDLRAGVALMSGQSQEGERLLSRAAEKASDNPLLWERLADVRRALGDVAGGQAASDRAAKIRKSMAEER